jgi:flavin reductase (DIM6/NTAB) family NADH-FMN oxidoreductase RutF
MNSPSTPFDIPQFKQALSRFPTGVSVITTHQGGEANPAEWGHSFVGLTASSFNSVSLTPPLVVWSLGLSSRTVPSFQKASHYVINILSDQQLPICQQFAFGQGDRFKGIDYELGATGLPVLKGALAWFECRNRSQYPEGDHIIFVGEVERCGFTDGSPLVYQQGGFHSAQKLPA